MGVKLPSFGGFTEHLKRAEIVREESIEVNGPRNCYVVEAEYDAPDFGFGGGTTHKTFWIDKDRFSILKEITTEPMKLGTMRGAETKYITTVEVVKLNEQLDDALFIFTPQAGTKEVKRLSGQQRAKTK